MKKKKKIALLLTTMLLSVVLLTGCNGESLLKSWNKDAQSYKELTSYVQEITTKGGESFIPEEDRIAVFDLDGTLYCETAPTYFDWCMYVYRIMDDPEFKDKATDEMKAVAETIKRIPEEGIPDWLELAHIENNAKAFKDMSVLDFQQYVRDFAKRDVPGFSNLTYANAFYRPMIEVIEYLKANDFKVFIVSGTDTWVNRTLIENVVDLPDYQVIGSEYNVEASGQDGQNGLDYVYSKDDEVVRDGTYAVKNVKMNKVVLITERIGQQPVLSFGNSSGDMSMAMFTTEDNPYLSKAFFNIADDTERENGKPEAAKEMLEKVKQNGWVPISMKDDWLTIYGDEVTKEK